ncbi:WD40-repeat-containing domain protein [Syncephalis plumigaleata]|nr:WD40-repeat-containing domain protein [Syncephalis plumigaleata]
MILDPLNNMGKTSGSTTLAESSRNAMGLTSVAQNGNEFTPGGFRREELVRLMQHTLQELGYSKSADQLQHESGYLAEDSVAMQFRQSGLLPSIGYDMTHKVEGQFYIRRQKYLEYLEQRQMSEALMVLQQELRPLQYDLAQLHLLSSLLMSSHEDLYERAAWDGRHEHISSYRMIPYGRLEALLRETINEQARNCIYHNVPNEAISLFGNHCCDQHNLPSETLHQLTKHTNEVWCVAFSHDGRYLASASKDRTAIIWETTNYQMVHKLDRHTGEVTYVSWSHDDTRLLTCSNDKHARVWNVQSGECILDIDRHREHVVAGAWLKDNSFVTGGLDKELFLWSLEGELKHQWTIGRVTDLDVSKDGKRLVATSQDQRLRVYDIPSKTLVCSPLTIWDLDNKRLVHRYHGHTQNRFVIRSCFGGVNEGFVASGSEDYNVCLWHRESEKLISTLKGHTMAVNDISWHPRNPAIFASASDDHTIRIWGPTASTTVSSKSPSIAITNNDKSTVFQCDIDDGNDDDEDDDDEDEENENENDVDDDDEEEEEEEEEDDDDDNESEETG